MTTPALQTRAFDSRVHRWMAMALIASLSSACTSPPLRLNEQATRVHAEGTLLIGEVVRPLSRSEILGRYRPADLAMAGWTQASGVNLVESIIETRQASGDCFYQDLGPSRPANFRHALYSIALQEQGWGWAGDEFIRRAPTTPTP